MEVSGDGIRQRSQSSFFNLTNREEFEEFCFQWWGGFWSGFGVNVQPFIPRLRFFFFFLKVEVSSRTLTPLFMPGSVHSDSAS